MRLVGPRFFRWKSVSTMRPPPSEGPSPALSFGLALFWKPTLGSGCRLPRKDHIKEGASRVDGSKPQHRQAAGPVSRNVKWFQEIVHADSTSKSIALESFSPAIERSLY